jgi:hypothetical protein
MRAETEELQTYENNRKELSVVKEAKILRNQRD